MSRCSSRRSRLAAAALAAQPVAGHPVTIPLAADGDDQDAPPVDEQPTDARPTDAQPTDDRVVVYDPVFITPAPVATPVGEVRGATGRPDVTPPATDTIAGSGPDSRTRPRPVLLVLGGLSALILLLGRCLAPDAASESLSPRRDGRPGCGPRIRVPSLARRQLHDGPRPDERHRPRVTRFDGGHGLVRVVPHLDVRQQHPTGAVEAAATPATAGPSRCGTPAATGPGPNETSVSSVSPGSM